MSQKFVFTLRKRGVVSIGTDEKPRPHLTLLWRHALRSQLISLGKPGVYILANLVPDDSYKQTLYVGKTDRSGFAEQPAPHLSYPKEWVAAICFSGDDLDPDLTQDEASFMEHLLLDDLSFRKGVGLSNAVSAPEELRVSLPQIRTLTRHAETILSLLGALGVSLGDKSKTNQSTLIIAPPPVTVEPVAETPARSSTHYPEKVPDLIAAGLLRVGSKLRSSVPKYPAEAEIADTRGEIRLLRHGQNRQGGWLRHVPKSEPTYSSPSKAGEVVIKAGGGGGATNGWTFWVAMSSGKTLAELRDEYIRRNW